MLTFTKFGDHGRFGNMLWQIAAVASMAKRYGTNYRLPRWKYQHLFENEVPQLPAITNNPEELIEEPSFSTPPEYYDQFKDKIRDRFVDVKGYFQNVGFLNNINVRKLFKFKKDVVEEVRNKYADILSKPTIMVGVRRGDYVDNPNYYELPARYYILALQKFDYKKFNIVFITDDINWCWFHFKSLTNAYFPQGTAEEHFVLGTLANNWIISNSTFHFWSAFLSDADRVIQPNHLFAGPLLEKEGDVNFYLDGGRFEIFEHDGHKIQLRDTTFTIPVKYDHEDRLRNLKIILTLLRNNFDTNIIVGEAGREDFKELAGDDHMNFRTSTFHRTAMLNYMAKSTKTDFVVNYDCDVVLAPMAILQSVELLRDDKADFVYPYKYLFVRVKNHKPILEKFDPAAFARVMTGADSRVRPSLGGAVFFNRDAFLHYGGENEKFVSYGPEDMERYERFTRLGLRCKRVRGHIYHLDHHVGIDSSMSQPHYEQNVCELEKIRDMSNSELWDYVESW
jgi:hypothetical protein